MHHDPIAEDGVSLREKERDLVTLALSFFTLAIGHGHGDGSDGRALGMRVMAARACHNATRLRSGLAGRRASRATRGDYRGSSNRNAPGTCEHAIGLRRLGRGRIRRLTRAICARVVT